MTSALWGTGESPDSQTSKGGSRTWALRLKSLAIILTTRLCRGGPRMLVQLAAAVLCFLLVISMFPEHLGAARYKHILPWNRPGAKTTDPEPEDTGHLRLVVFGSQDLLGSAADARAGRTTWTDQLCHELNCSSSVSFVPAADISPGLTSNAIYDTELQDLEEVARDANITEKPADDYFFLAEQYPVPARTPDLEGQIQEFLARPLGKAPRETIWVFTFGTWDVWNLAAMPLPRGEELVDKLSVHLFSQIELLYEKSLDPASIAFSDFSVPEADQTADPAAPDAPEGEKTSEIEAFRIVIPQLFDMSLTPGWHERPSPSMPHTKAEQLRNTAVLTKRWNKAIQAEMDNWQRKERALPEGMKVADDAVEPVEHVELVEPVEGAKRRAPDDAVPGPEQPDQDGEKAADEVEATASEPQRPLRLGLVSDPGARTLDAMTEEEMQRSGLHDSEGRGDVPADDPMRFLDVWTPCMSTPEAGRCATPDDHLFYDAFTLGQRAIDGLTKQTAESVVDRLGVQIEGRAAAVDRRRRRAFRA